MPAVDRRRFLQIAGGATAATMLDRQHRPGGGAPRQPRDRLPQGRRAHRRPDAGEPLLRPLLRHAARRPRLRRPAPGDAAAAASRSGTSPTATREILPFRPDMEDLGLVFLEDLPHSWTDTQDALNGATTTSGSRTRATTTMAHLRRRDAPFHYALADAFTVCDAYYCSFIGNTDPNRYYMWTGWTGNDGKGGGPVLYNDELGYDWTTYPERLAEGRRLLEDLPGHRARPGPGALLGLDRRRLHRQLRRQLAAVLPHLPERRARQPALPTRAKTGTDIQGLGHATSTCCARTSSAGSLPQVSWVVAPEAFSEHPNWPVNFGAWYVSQGPRRAHLQPRGVGARRRC